MKHTSRASVTSRDGWEVTQKLELLAIFIRQRQQVFWPVALCHAIPAGGCTAEKHGREMTNVKTILYIFSYQFSSLMKIFGWTTSVVLGTVTTFSISLFYQEWYQYNTIEAAAYISLHKLTWGIANGWLIIACATGNGGTCEYFGFKSGVHKLRGVKCINYNSRIYSLSTIRSLYRLRSAYGMSAVEDRSLQRSLREVRVYVQHRTSFD